MKTLKPNADSSDLELARRLSGILIRGDESSSQTGGGYLADRCVALRRRSSAPTRPHLGSHRSHTESTASLLEPPVDLDSWDLLLDWAMEISRARAAFIVDSQGFVIASRGNPSSEGVVGLGAELCYIMDQVTEMDVDSGTVMSLELQFEAKRLTAFRGVLADDSTVSVGLISSARPPDDVIRVLTEQFTHWLRDRL